MARLFLVRGVPGSGKSTFGKLLANSMCHANCYTVHIETDMVRDNWEGGREAFPWDAKHNEWAHRLCLSVAAANIYNGNNVVVSNTFCTIERMRPYFRMAAMHGAEVTVLHVQGRHGSIHDGVEQDKYEAEWEEYKGELH